jgi:hypothetical protein
MKTKNIFVLCSFLCFANLLFAQKEAIKELHSDGGGWAVYEVQEAGDKTILLIGNSIYNGFKGHLAKELPGYRVVAWINPYYLGQNHWEEDLVNVLQREKYDLIHFNIGLHGYPEGRIPEGQYQSLLQHFVDLLKQYCPDSKIMWSSTTPITNKEKPYITYEKLNSIIIDRNQIAVIVMKNNGIPVNDLYTLCLLNMEKARGDQFHWNDQMYKMIAIQTAAKIKEEL